MEQATLYAPDISCGHCVASIQKAVGKLSGVAKVEGDPSTRNVTVTFDPSKVSIAQIESTMAEEGYPIAKG